MAIKKYKPVTPGQRNKAISSFEEITAKKPYKKLLEPLKSSGGRNNTGQMTVRYRGGGHKRRAHHRVRSEPLRPHRPHPV